MPGITGIISEKGSGFDSLHKLMVESLNHFNYKTESVSKGPVHFGLVHHGYLHKNNSFHTSKDGRYLLSFIGEIFSYKSIETQQIVDDQEFFLQLLINEGPDCLKDINGHYCASLYDFNEEKLFLFSDRMGTRPLYYAFFNNTFLFAPEIKSILTSNIPREIDNSAVSDLFSFGHLFGHKTLFAGISQLPEASYLVYYKGKLNIHNYWQLPEYKEAYQLTWPSKRKIDALTEELIEIFTKAMHRNFTKNSDSILLSLSGGLDSRYVAAFAKKFDINPLISFTMGPPDSADQIYSKIVAGKLGIQHNPFEVKPENIWKDAGRFAYFADYMSPINGPIQGFEALEHFYGKCQITVSSQMCDAIFGGNLWRRSLRILIGKKEFDTEAEKVVTDSFKLFDDTHLSQIFSKEYYAGFQGRYQEVPQHYIKSTRIPLHAYINLLLNEHGRRGTLSGNLMNNLYVETRMPSYDNEVIDFAYKLPLRLREHQYIYRKAFSQMFPELAKIKRERYNIAVNASNTRYQLSILENKMAVVLNKTKLRPFVKLIAKYNRPTYINYDGWFKNELLKSMTGLILDERTISRGIFNKDGLEKLIHSHLKHSNNHARLLWQVINLEYFYRNYID